MGVQPQHNLRGARQEPHQKRGERLNRAENPGNMHMYFRKFMKNVIKKKSFAKKFEMHAVFS